jgi:hypothetical protein
VTAPYGRFLAPESVRASLRKAELSLALNQQREANLTSLSLDRRREQRLKRLRARRWELREEIKVLRDLLGVDA